MLLTPAGGRRDSDSVPEKRRPSMVQSEYLPRIREGELDHSRSGARPRHYPESQIGHDYSRKSSFSDRDSEFGSIQSNLHRVASKTSSVRRNSDASCYDDDKSDIDGSLGWKHSPSPGIERRESYFPSAASNRRPSMSERTSGRDNEYSESFGRTLEEGRHRKKDIDGSFGWDPDVRPPMKLDVVSPYKQNNSHGGRHEDRRYQEVDSRGSRRY